MRWREILARTRHLIRLGFADPPSPSRNIVAARRRKGSFSSLFRSQLTSLHPALRALGSLPSKGKALGIAKISFEGKAFGARKKRLPLEGKLAAARLTDEVERNSFAQAPPHPSRLRRSTFPSRGRLFYDRTFYSFENSSLPTPQVGQTQSSGRSSNAVPGAMPLSGSPTSGSYS